MAGHLRVALIGAGSVGVAVATRLRRRGHVVAGVASRTATSAERAGAALGAPVFDARRTLPESDLVLIATPDDAIEPVATAVARRLGGDEIACHFAGALGVKPLQAVVDAGAAACALHPVQALPDPVTAVERLPGSSWGVTCPPGIREWAFEFVSLELDGRPVWVAEDHRPLWHAAAVMTSAGLRALLSSAGGMLRRGGVAEPMAVLAPLVEGTLENALEGEGPTLTGPFVRGEANTVARHLEALESFAPELRDDYARIAGMILEGAARSGRLSREAQTSISALLASR